MEKPRKHENIEEDWEDFMNFLSRAKIRMDGFPDLMLQE